MLSRIINNRRGQAKSHRRSLSILHRVVGLARVGKRGFASEVSAYNRNRYRSLAALGQAITIPGSRARHLLLIQKGVAANRVPTITTLLPAADGAEEKATTEENYFPNIEKYLDTGEGPKPVVPCSICYRALIIQGLQEPDDYHTTWTQEDCSEYEEPYILRCRHILGRECLSRWCCRILRKEDFPPGPLCPVCRDPVCTSLQDLEVARWGGLIPQGLRVRGVPHHEEEEVGEEEVGEEEFSEEETSEDDEWEWWVITTLRAERGE